MKQVSMTIIVSDADAGSIASQMIDFANNTSEFVHIWTTGYIENTTVEQDDVMKQEHPELFKK